MRKYKLIGEILSPVHIGAGSEIEFFDYIIKNGKFYKIFFDEFLFNLREPERNKLITLINQNNLLDLRKFIISNWNPQRFPFEYSCDVSEEVNKLYINNVNNIENQLLINPFIRTTTKKIPYLPASSLKGAIRTAVISELARNINISSENKRRIEGYVLECLDKKGRLDQSKDPFRAIKIKDAHLASNEIIISRVVNVRKNKMSQLETLGIQVFAEITHSILSGRTVTFESELTIDSELQDTNFLKRKIDIDLIKKSCNSFYLHKMYYEIEKFYKSTPVEKYYSIISNQKFTNNSFLIRIGKFSGLESVTLDKYRKPIVSWGKTRNICEMKYPFGWIKLSFQEV